MKNLGRLAATVFFAFSILSSPCMLPAQDTPFPDSKNPLYVAHYMTWFGLPETSGDWFQWRFDMGLVGIEKHHYPDLVLANGRRDVAAVHYPSIGPYDSTDPNLCEYHILLAKEAGINAFMVNWYGFEHEGGRRRQEDKGFERLLLVAEKLNFKICLNFDDKSAFPPYWRFKNRGDAVAYAQKVLTKAMERYSSSSAYLKIDGRPVLSNFSSAFVTSDSIEHISFSSAEWDGILKSLSGFNPVFIHDHQWYWRKSIADAGFLKFSDSIYSWVGKKEEQEEFLRESKELQRKRKLKFITAIANPGFDNTACWGWGGGISQVPRKDGQVYVDSIEDGLKYGAGFMHLVTWNDYAEGSTIEPTEEYGDRYLRITARYSRKLDEAKVSLLRFDLPIKIYRMRTRRAKLNPNMVVSARALESFDRRLNEASALFLQENYGQVEQILADLEGTLKSEEDYMAKSIKLEASLSPATQELFAGEFGRLQLKLKNTSKEIMPVYAELNRTKIPRSWLGDLESEVWLRAGEEKTIDYTINVATDAGEMLGWFTASVDSPYLPVVSNVSHLRIFQPHIKADIVPFNLLRPGKDEKVNLILDIKQKSAQKAKLILSAPNGWIARSESVIIDLPRMGSVEIPLVLRAPELGRSSGNLSVRLLCDDGQKLNFEEPFGILLPGTASVLEGDINQDGVRDFVLGNAAVEVHVTEAIGGRILSILNRETGHNQLFLDYPRVARTEGATWDKWAEYGGINDWFPGDWPGKVWNNNWTGVIRQDKRMAAVILTAQTDDGLQIQREIQVKPSASSVKTIYEIKNLSGSEHIVVWTNHPDLAPGSTAGDEDVLVVPVSGKPSLEKKMFEPRLQKTHFVPHENWMLAHDSKTGEFIGQVYDHAQVEKVGLWEGKNFFTMELLLNKMLLAPGAKKIFSVEYVVGQNDLDSAIGFMKKRGQMEPPSQ